MHKEERRKGVLPRAGKWRDGFDDLGFKAYSDDLLKYQGIRDMDSTVKVSHFRLFYKMGKLLFGPESREVLDWALHRIDQPLPKHLAPFDPQLILDLKKQITCEPFWLPIAIVNYISVVHSTSR